MIKSISIALMLAITGYFILTSLGGEGEGSPRKQRHESVFALSFQVDGAPYSTVKALFCADRAGYNVIPCVSRMTEDSVTVPKGQEANNVLWIHELLETNDQKTGMWCDIVSGEHSIISSGFDSDVKRLISSALEASAQPKSKEGGGGFIRVFGDWEGLRSGVLWLSDDDIADYIFKVLTVRSKSAFGVYNLGDLVALSYSLSNDLKPLLSLFTLECRMVEEGEESDYAGEKKNNKSVGCILELAVPPQTVEMMKNTENRLLSDLQEFTGEFKAFLHFAFPLSWVREDEEEEEKEEEDEESDTFAKGREFAYVDYGESIRFVKGQSVYEEDGAPATFVNGKIVEDFLFMGEPKPAVIDLRNLEDFTPVKFMEGQRDGESPTARKAFTVTLLSYRDGYGPHKDMYLAALDKSTSASLKKYLSIDPSSRGKSELTLSDFAELKPQFVPNPDLVELHSRALLSKLIAWSDREEEIYSAFVMYPQDKRDYIVNRLMDIHGIIKVVLDRNNPYEVVIIKSPLFKWEDLLKRVNAVLLPHLQPIGMRLPTPES